MPDPFELFFSQNLDNFRPYQTIMYDIWFVGPIQTYLDLFGPNETYLDLY